MASLCSKSHILWLVFLTTLCATAKAQASKTYTVTLLPVLGRGNMPFIVDCAYNAKPFVSKTMTWGTFKWDLMVDVPTNEEVVVNCNFRLTNPYFRHTTFPIFQSGSKISNCAHDHSLWTINLNGFYFSCEGEDPQLWHQCQY
ncbi:Plant self-incompatibility S1 [Dillenia turbinata]|uniref:Plant self-incompatibility S1 n=1 Tax=Dillenia turbinata TaxID=194707 RepID=A0AAN8VTM3_9MAGN